MPQLYLLGGPNGAGKTTSAYALLRSELSAIEFVNADIIAARLNPAHPESVAFRAGRMMLERLEQLILYGSDFIFESTLASRSFARLLLRCRERAYFVNLLYFWLDSPELAVSRVANRVRSGGHFVAPEDVRRRYDRSIANLRELYIPLADSWRVYDNSCETARKLAEGNRTDSITIYDQQGWQSLTGAEDV
ncbi:zeta toxin family protein [Gloeobacter kilaueensis]|uniref:UDP-N-acetylglucosamine kinase n=1 Tax=Gloeobacter kilaueensis (strain ATCC BAA-2537 / CCAP 1431/1 / ULC 316 / JS1) TaxID=1183438 RepID=U5QGE5_GLOK1|nr:zeta toxin family protein [Gloeobacter kilaueensis]AGY57991.1 hypothetical protein GKIL_1745 [Gloeobacter kilaueensis JS1]